MKPCPLCHAAVSDDVVYAPGARFCGACGRNGEQVRQAPTLPPGAVPFMTEVPGAPPIIGPQPWVGAAQNDAAQGGAPPGLNWGGFLLPFIWGPVNSVWIGLLALIGFLPYIGFLISLGVSVYLLIKGNDLAWRSGRAWQSVEQFQAVQKAWTIWGLVATGATIVVVMLVYGAMSTQGVGGGPYVPAQ